MKSRKGSAILFVAIGLAIVFASLAGYFYFQNQQLTSQDQILVPPTETTTDETVGWKTYTGDFYTFKYPATKDFVETVDKDIVAVMAPRSDYGLTVRTIENSRGLTPKGLATEGIMNDGTQINGKRLEASDFTFPEVTVAGAKGVKVSGPIPEYLLVPYKDKMLKINGSTLEPKLFDQILSTFKFTDSQAEVEPVAPLTKVPVVSTAGWQKASLNGVQFMIPADFHYKANGDNIGLIFPPPPSVIPWWITVADYQGGSRREQLLGKDPQDCHYIYEDSTFGSVKAIQVAADGGWCQGGYAGGIAAVVGDKLVMFSGLFYDLDTKVIRRSDVRDTIVSTLKTSN